MIVEHIFVASQPRMPQIELDEADVVAGKGIAGDHNFANRTAAGQNITLVEAEEVEAFLSRFNRPRIMSITRRNLVTRGVRLNDLVGKQFAVGSVKLRGVELCEPCMILGKSLATDALPAAKVIEHFVHRAGLRADVLTDGTIAKGAPIVIASQH